MAAATETEAHLNNAQQLLRDLKPELRSRLLHRLGRTALNGAALVADGLRQVGVRRLCGIGGTPVDGIFAAASRIGISIISPRHQASAALMAAATNYLTGSLENAVVVSAGPAVTNTVTGVLVARDNHWPLLVMGGRRALRDEGAGYFQEMDAVPIMRSITKWAATVSSAESLIPTLREAVERSVSGTPGPVYLDLPEDVLAQAAVPAQTPPVVRVPHPSAAAPDLDRAFALIRSAKRPLLCLGEDIRWTVDAAALRRLVEHEQLPFITTSLARGYVPDDHPMCFNVVRHRVPARCDLVIMVGAWFDWRFRHGVEFAPDAQVLHVDPDDRTRGRNREAALAIKAEDGRFLNSLSRRSLREVAAERSDWIEELSQIRAKELTEQDAWRSQRHDPLLPQQLYDALIGALPDDAFLVVDGGVHLACAQHLVRITRPLSWFDATWSGCIGAGIPLGLAARLAFPDRPVVVVAGDTGFGMSGMEIETAVRNNLPMLLIVVNNDGVNGHVRQENLLRSPIDEPFYVFSSGLAYAGVARSLGVEHAVSVSSAASLESLVRKALDHRELTCLDVRVDPHAPIPPVW